MQSPLTDAFSVSFIKFDSMSTITHCNQALKLLSDDENHYTLLMNEFMSMLVHSDKKLDKLREWHPQVVWGQLRDTYSSP